MKIKTHLTQREYINASFAVMTARPFMRYIFGFLILIGLVNLISSIAMDKFSLAGVLPPFIIFGLFAGILYLSIRKSYSMNSRISENIEYIFDPGNLTIQGESFKSELSWNKIYKVSKTKNWLMIWQNRQVSNAIPIRNVGEEDLDELKVILADNQVKNNL